MLNNVIRLININKTLVIDANKNYLCNVFFMVLDY